MAKVREKMKETSIDDVSVFSGMRASRPRRHQNGMKSTSDFTSYKFSTYMRGEQEW